jgi:tetratricopeptide (TPR) repeat protein
MRDALHRQLDDALAKAPELLDLRTDWGGLPWVELQWRQPSPMMPATLDLPVPYPIVSGADVDEINRLIVAGGNLAIADSMIWSRLDRTPSDGRIWALLAALELRRLRYRAAYAAAQRACELDPSLENAHFLAGRAALESGRLADAQAAFARAFPPMRGGPLATLWRAVVARISGDGAGARRLFEIVATGANRVLGSVALRCLGDLERAARTNPMDDVSREMRVRLSAPRALEGARVIVRQEGGLGDAIQNIRWALVLRARGARSITFQGEKSLGEWFAQSRIVDAAIGLHEPPWADFVVSSESLELLCAEEGALIATAGYLPRSLSPPARPRPLIGIAHAGGAHMEGDIVRSLPPDAALRLIALCPQADWINVLGGPRSAELPSLPAPLAQLPGFTEAARRVAACDLIVTVDANALHLAGAMGVPTLGLLAAWRDHRWGCFGERAPYYDSVRLIRQERLGEWEPVIERAAAAIREATPPSAA